MEISTTINLKEQDGQERTGVLRLRCETGGARGRENFSRAWKHSRVENPPLVPPRHRSPLNGLWRLPSDDSAALAGLLPEEQRQRLKARVRKRNSKYTFTAAKHPRTAQLYTFHFEMVKEGRLDNFNAS